jgi:hypothetical protein
MRSKVISEYEQGGVVTIYISPEATHLAGINKEIKNLCGCVYGSFERIYDPVGIIIGACEVTQDDQVSDILETREGFDSHTIPTRSQRIGQTLSEISEWIARVNENSENAIYIASVEFQKPTVSVYLPVGEISVSTEDSERYRFHKRGKDLGQAPDQPPFDLTILHHSNKYVRTEGFELDHVYQVKINVSSKVFFEESQIGQINRARLSESIDRLRNQTKVFDTVLQGSFPKKPWMEERLLEYDGPSSEELIRQYQLKWVDEELLGTESKYAEDGTEVVEFSTDQTDILTEELRKRIEVYLEENPANGPHIDADLLRITRPDMEPLEGRLDESGVMWTDTEQDST